MNNRVPHYMAYTTPAGNLIPSTIRQKQADALYALRQSDARHRHELSACKLVKVKVEVIQ
jgi:hypothetical protein